MRELFPLDGAACADAVGPDLFSERLSHPSARLYCLNCIVRAPCYLTALRDGLVGTWGGVWIEEKAERRRVTSGRIREVAGEARRYLFDRFGIFIKDSAHVEKELRKAVRRM